MGRNQMVLKSLKEENIILNESKEYFKHYKNINYKKYHVTTNNETLNDLELIINNLIQQTKDSELKLSLEIILTVITHENLNIRAYALEKAYFLFNEDYIKEIIIKELRNMVSNRKEDTNNYAQYSLDLIASNIYDLEIFSISKYLLMKILKIIKLKLRESKYSLINPFDKFISFNLKPNDNILSQNKIFKYILQKYRVFDHMITIKIPFIGKIENIDAESLIEDEYIPYYQILSLEYNKKDAIQRMAKLYVKTFRENGHLRRLFNLLDDEDYYNQKLGIDALMEVSKVLISSYRNNKSLDTFNKPQANNSIIIKDNKH